MDTLRALGRELERHSETPTAAVIDIQSVKTAESGGTAGYDTGKEVRGRKRRLAVDVVGFTVLYRRWVVERTFAWMSRCRRPAKDYERSLEVSSARAQLTACRFMTRRIGRVATCCNKQ